MFSAWTRTSKNVLFLGAFVFFDLVAFCDSSRAEQCSDPRFQSVRSSLVAQHDAMLARLKRSGDCSIVADILAFDRRANAQINAALRSASGCWWTPPSTNSGKMASLLRQYCRPTSTQASSKSSPQNQESRQAGVTQQNTPLQPSAAPSSARQQQSADCSDITGTGGGSGPSNCTPSNGVPPNVQAQINQAKSYMQAAQTTKESYTSYSGWMSAAQKFRKAAAAFQAAGDLADAAAASEQAQTLENALKSQQSGPSSAATQPPAAQPSSSAASSCPPLAPAGPWQGSNAAYCANANCVDRGSAYYGMMCFPPNQVSGGKPQPAAQQQQASTQQQQTMVPVPDVNSLREQQRTCSDITGLGGGGSGPSNCPPSTGQPQQPTLPNAGLSQTVNQPPSPSAISQNFANAIQSLADTLLDQPDDSDLRAKFLRRMQRTLADHHVPMKPKDYACLQPDNRTSGNGRKLIDIPLRWRPQNIKKEAIDRSHLCDGVSEGDAKEACREEKYGQAVMWAEPELAGLCRADGGPDHDVEKVAECAKRKFLNAWANNEGIVREALLAGSNTSAVCDTSVPLATRKQTLRDLLRQRLTAALAAEQSGNDSGQPEQQTPVATTAENAPTPPPAQVPSTDDNEAYCSYLAREVVRGELTPGAGTPIPPGCKTAVAAAEALRKQQQANGVPPFSMSDVDTDKEIGQLMGGLAAAQKQ
jgi:hypothetical protein